MKGKNQDETKISKVLEFKDNQTREESFENINIDNDDLNTKPRDVKKIEDTDKQKKLIKLKDKSSKHRNKKSEDKSKKGSVTKLRTCTIKYNHISVLLILSINNNL